jgi:hypothetical protein
MFILQLKRMSSYTISRITRISRRKNTGLKPRDYEPTDKSARDAPRPGRAGHGRYIGGEFQLAEAYS